MFAVIDTREEKLQAKVNAAIKLVIAEALGIDRYSAIKDNAKKRQIVLQCPEQVEE